MDQAKQKLEKTLQVVADDMATIRVGGAKASMVEHVEVEAYGPGQRMKLVELATISAPDPQQIVISPWDKSVLRPIEKAIIESNLGLMPNVNGEVIRIIVPALTEERRQDFVKLLNQKLESGHVMLRGVRQDLKEDIENKKGPGVSEDDITRELEDLQKLMDEYMAKLEAMAKTKEEEIMRL
jgi:ribosome recycling factor